MKVGIIGAGTMGSGIAQVFAQNEGFDVLLCSSNRESAQRGKTRLESRLKKRVVSGKITQESADRILTRIQVCIKADCNDCDMIVESVREEMGTKKRLFDEMQEICKPDCIFATNTSSLSITELSESVKQAVVGMHFFNPAPVMKLVEVVAGRNTPEDVLNTVTEICRRIGKTPVRVKESSGFIVNRILIPTINEAIGLYADGVASAEDIDTAMKLGANYPMGPLELGDYIGLDVCLAILNTMKDCTGDDKFRPHPMLKQLVNKGCLGLKTGEGIYKYGNHSLE